MMFMAVKSKLCFLQNLLAENSYNLTPVLPVIPSMHGPAYTITITTVNTKGQYKEKH